MQTANKDCLPLGAKLTDAQYASLRAGNLYVNVHTVAHPGGEPRAQLKP
ncbi:MAG: CHRD domain-containing protein [Candidatus Competibacter sp.]|nr:CHRD domain-containing protein [Candidatus Competibacter sp.]